MAIDIFERLGDKVEGVDKDEEVSEVEVDILRRFNRLVTIGRTSVMDATKSREIFMSDGGEEGVLAIEGKLLWVARGLGTGTKSSSLLDTSILNSETISSRRVGRRSCRKNKVEGSMVQRNPSRWAPK
jgi:hypothetical protein